MKVILLWEVMMPCDLRIHLPFQYKGNAHPQQK